jgi:hypothetical protein
MVERLMALRGASMAVQLAPGSLRGASGRCHAKTAETEAVAGQAIVRAFPLRIVQLQISRLK